MKIPNFKFEKELWRKDYRLVAGIDEVGRGAWAGPLVAAATIFRSSLQGSAFLQGLALKYFKARPYGTYGKIRDSKQLSPLQRERLDPFIKKNCLAYSIAEISVKIINREGIAKATQRAFRKCLKSLKPQADFVLVDAFPVKYLAGKRQMPIIKGDQKSLSIAAASIIAKVYRDNLIRKLHEKNGRYSFDKNKGYGTKLHQELIRKHGISKDHRINFVPNHLLGKRSNTKKSPRKAIATMPDLDFKKKQGQNH